MAKSTEFELLGKIGEGGMGEVYRARLFNEHGFEKIVAAKRVSGAFSDKNLLHEAKVLSKLNHPNICSVFDIREYQGNIYILMEHIDGMSISDVHDLSMQKGYKFSEKFILQFSYYALRGLEYAHSEKGEKKALIHRDISPQNIMIDTDGNLKILDFGIAKIAQGDNTNTSEFRYGKIRYCAPEIIKGGRFTEKSDLYSLGVVIFELCSGVTAFLAESDAHLVSQKVDLELNYNSIFKRGYGESLKEFISRLSASEDAGRFSTASEAIEYLDKKCGVLETLNNNSLLAAELKRIKSSEVDRTETIIVPTRQKKSVKTKALLIGSGIICLLYLSFFMLKARQKDQDFVTILIKSEGQSVALAPIENKKKDHLKAAFSAYNCRYAIHGMLGFSKALSDRSLEKGVGRFATFDEVLRDLILWHQHSWSLAEFLKANCPKGNDFDDSIELLRNRHLFLNELVKQKIGSWDNLRRELKRFSFDDKKEHAKIYVDISVEDIGRLTDQLGKMQSITVDGSFGFGLASVDENFFPKNENECMALADASLIKYVQNQPANPNFLFNTSMVIVPFPLNAAILNQSWNHLEYEDFAKADQSSFRKFGICVFKRKNGVVVESSLRKL